MALAFATTPDAPVRCAMQASKALLSHPELKVRMGVHSGPVSGMTDVNDRSNVAGAGMNMAQRVMDCGDAGHILLSKRVAEDLAQYRHWQPNLHDLGECEVKHDVIVAVVNLYTDEIGNPVLPEKFKGKTPKRRTADGAVRLSPLPARNTLLTVLFFSAVVLAIAYWIFFPPAAPHSLESPAAPRIKATAAPAKSVAVLPFENERGVGFAFSDPLFLRSTFLRITFLLHVGPRLFGVEGHAPAAAKDTVVALHQRGERGPRRLIESLYGVPRLDHEVTLTRAMARASWFRTSGAAGRLALRLAYRDDVPHLCCPAWRVMPSRELISVQE